MPLSPTVRTGLTALALAGAGLLAAGSASAAPAPRAALAVVTCDPDVFSVQSPNALSAMTSVTSVRGLSCKGALGVVRRNAAKAGKAPYVRGGAFRLGAYRCVNLLHQGELYRARCTRGAHAFRIEYGS